MIKSLAFILYPVADIPAARNFYEKALGLRLTHQFQDAWFEYDLGDTTFAISLADADHPTPVRGALLAFEVDDLNAELARLQGLGIAVGASVGDTPVCRMLTLHDPSNNEIVLHQRKV